MNIKSGVRKTPKICMNIAVEMWYNGLTTLTLVTMDEILAHTPDCVGCQKRISRYLRTSKNGEKSIARSLVKRS